jgi:hypothetical protein
LRQSLALSDVPVQIIKALELPNSLSLGQFLTLHSGWHTIAVPQDRWQDWICLCLGILCLGCSQWNNLGVSYLLGANICLLNIFWVLRQENPAGRLPFTWGATSESFGPNLLCRPNNGEAAPQMQFTEGIFVDYRSFDARNIKPIYEFGFRLSYTSFQYSNVRINKINTGPYTPNTGMTAAAPILGNFSINLADYLFPKWWRHYTEYIYPWITSTDGKTASGDANYRLPANS